ncbi:hypothetical protein [Flavobacterium nitrogenifigens]|uniref:Uncharacterized protein n=1 Tax=Flavobacterium nitrogenifigens TaxID=1617283 RepID=A0A521BK37_9FLAO|nr:hypothetical protein [Flavobacterium nitrogenifigens]KAF2330914.1 hypothetical protein DM397_14085 [Flavobacterium nitrogenifigens]SMO47442.1 hypothetical protein SAMN06265220_1011066 [Flavobacterium nitrogenifigens]
MKIYIILIAILSFKVFSQNHKNIFVFEFDKKTDEIVYRESVKTQEILGFTFMINDEKIFFSSNPSSSNKLKVNTSRKQLNEIVKNDNANKTYHFFVYLKDKKKYYSVDHLVRKITCE